LSPQAAEACTIAIGADPPPPRTAAERRAQRLWIAETHRQYVRQVTDAYRAASALIEVEVLDVPADWRQPIRVRVTGVYKGAFNPLAFLGY